MVPCGTHACGILAKKKKERKGEREREKKQKKRERRASVGSDRGREIEKG